MANRTAANPIVWPCSIYWDGNDGRWNSFVIQVGSPPQEFRIFPSTSGQQTWVPVPDGCTFANPQDPGSCGYARGALPVIQVNSSGFSENASSTWDPIGIYTLTGQETELGYNGNGEYGLENVTLAGNNGIASQGKQVVAGIVTPDYWLGQFGLGPNPTNFSSLNLSIPSYMSGLVSSNQIPSLSWGYTAGALYRDQTCASLTLGGHDSSRWEFGNSISTSMNADSSRPLQIAVQRILAGGLPGTSQQLNLLPTPVYEFIDSTVPHIWLPQDAIDAFVRNFGLTYDNQTDLYLINSTMRDRNLSANPTLTFLLAETATLGASRTIEISLPYKAFDLEASYPFYQHATKYFPIRLAHNESQLTLGRTFLQEAYIIADFERQNFTVAQAYYDNSKATDIQSIEKPEPNGNSTNSTSGSSTTGPSTGAHHSGYSAGAIAGIVVATVSFAALIAVVAWLVARRCLRQRRKVEEEANLAEKDDQTDGALQQGAHSSTQGAAVNSADGGKDPLNFNELSAEHARSELLAVKRASEIDGTSSKRASHVSQIPGRDSARFVEAPGSEGHRFELPGNGLGG